jgi:hypothetical protein
VDFGQTTGGIPALTGTDFFGNFAQGAPPTNPFEIAIPSATGANAAGDLNSTYYPLFYSIANLNAWMASQNYCPVEMVIVGNFPNARYFSITANDMHYTATHHLADADMDPAIGFVNGGSNPFTPSNSYTGSQPYVVPVSFGWVPTYPGTAALGTWTYGAGTKTCAIDPYEEDNLIDGTQRHLSTDWNTNVNPALPNAAAGGALIPHVVDTPEHTSLSSFSAICPSCGPDLAGSVIARSYLAPPDSCSGTPGSGNLYCTPQVAPQQPYLIVRDVNSGCAYFSAYLTAASWTPNGQPNAQPLVYAPAAGTTPPNCSLTPQPTGCDAVVSVADLGNCTTNYSSNCGTVPNWLDRTQQAQHALDANLTPQACYANGNPAQSPTLSSGPPNFYNRVAWTRVAEWYGSPGPDDSYIGGAIPKTELQKMQPGTACPDSQGNQSVDGCLIRLRFQVPAMPDTPCVSGSTCYLTGNEQMRYLSLSFWQDAATKQDLEADPDLNYIADPDGIETPTSLSRSFRLALPTRRFARRPPRSVHPAMRRSF